MLSRLAGRLQVQLQWRSGGVHPHTHAHTQMHTRALRTTYFPRGNSGNSHRDNWQRFFRRGFNPHPNHLLYSVMGANVAVYALFVLSDAQWKRFNDPRWIRFMLKNFTASWYNLSSGRLHTLLTSSFLHTRVDSLIFNMLTFYLMAPHAIAMLGARTFLALYCGGGLAASAATLSNPSNGASGAVGSTLGFFAAANPHATFSLYFFLPVQAWMAVGGLVAWDAYNTLTSPYSVGAHKSRLSGTLAGVAFAMFRMRAIGPRVPWR
ncbi:hypothetical protein E3P86_00768 [Wallemia ichthyophaga]|uniref:Peptidase S54 rhomboid domain-containing protein n=1 Tax=Wallemia ichthyophaga TaxID=245174 RepID=A0A4T0JBX0_WALIC|nr:hypothetical protein E3P86_00768 [Wallemia ichthyophaga]